MGPVTALCRYPVKGLPPEDLDRIALVAGAAMPGDRRHALTHGQSAFDMSQPAWVPRGNFVVVARSPGLAALRLRTDGGALQISAPDGASIAVDLDAASDRADLVAFIQRHADQPGPSSVVEVPGQSLPDTPMPALSIMSDASLVALSAAAGQPLDRRRFRGNLWLSGDAPWAEQALVGNRFRIGGVLFEGVQEIDRCRAVDANPATGDRDSDLCRQLHGLTGAPNFGILARVVEGGTVSLGDALTPS